MDNIYKFILVLIFLILAIFGILLLFVQEGSMTAGILLGVFSTLVVILLSFGMFQVQQWISSVREERNFRANQKLDLDNALKQQRLLNAQNDNLMKQVNQKPLETAPPLLIPDGLFRDLDD